LGLISQIANASSQPLGHPRDPAIASWFGGGSSTEAGENVTPDTALQSTAVLACVREISSSASSIPTSLYSRTRGGEKNVAFKNPVHKLIHSRPNQWHTPFEWKEMMSWHVLLRGNAYSEIIHSGGRAIEALVPLHPDRVTPFMAPNGRIAYHYQPEDGPGRVILQHEMHHWRTFSGDGITGRSVLTFIRETIGLDIAVAKYAGRFFKNDASPNGVITHPSHFKEDGSFERFKESWQAAQSGKNKHKTAILENGMEYQTLGVSNKDSQFLELRKFNVPDICRAFGVPPHKAGDLEKASFSNIDKQEISFVTGTVRPFTTRIAQAMNRDLLTEKQQETLFFEFILEDLLRGDPEARGNFYTSMFNIGGISQNEIRKKENMNPIEGGDKYYVPLNMVATDELPNGEKKDADKNNA